MARKLHKKTRLVYGVGINDADYPTQPRVDGKRVICYYYSIWKGVLQRCYCKKTQYKHASYKDCKIHKDWLHFSKFRSWMQLQDWKGKDLDKDLLSKGEKIYSPETCAFVDRRVNSFITDRFANKGEYPVGVRYKKTVKGPNRFESRCNNPFTKITESLGTFPCPNQAHEAWRKRKHELACQLADLQTDPRVAEALRKRYL